MTTWAITPIKAPEHCKTRLRGVLSETARVELVGAMLRHVVRVAASSRAVDRVFVLGPSDHGLSDIALLPDHGEGLNAELARVMQTAREAGVHRVIILPADLPLLTREDVDFLAARRGDSAAIAPDRAGTGTNALALPPTNVFHFCFGADSFAGHCAEIARIGLASHVRASETLGLDIDEPADLALLPAAFRPSA